MKKTVIGAVLAFISSLWAIVIGIYVQKEGYGNRFWALTVDRGVAVPLVAALLILGLSLVILGVEYLRKEK